MPPPSLDRRRLLLGAGALGLGWLGCQRLPWMASGSLPQQAYVWQRVWNDPVREAVLGASLDVSGLVVLGAEVQWTREEFEKYPVGFDGTALRQAGVPVGLAIRVHEAKAGLGAEQARAVAAQIEEALERAARASLPVNEVQVDLDCPASRLDGYRRWLPSLRGATGGARLTFTALPSWLKRPAFWGLLSAADGYVLQVHGVERASAGARLFDREQARRAVDLAGALGAPFRLALPTYGYRLALGADRKLAGIAAEGAPPWPEEVEVRRVAAPAPEVAALVRSLQDGRPGALRGLLWYRLPVRGAELNWTMTTLRSVQRGVAPRARLRGEVVPLDEGGWSVALRNEGDDDAFLTGTVEVRWEAGRCVASDGVGGVEVAPDGGDRRRFLVRRELRVPPGLRREIGWIRIEDARGLWVQVNDEAMG